MYGATLLVAMLATQPLRSTPEERAVAFLVREVPRWPEQNRCFSCHNNGDAARALMAAKAASYDVPAAALTETLRWLARPAQWDHNRGDERFSDKGLARIQFAAALMDVKPGPDRKSVLTAAELVAQDQQQGGSWKAGTDGTLGSPITYGPLLATHFARSVLRAADKKHYAKALDRGDRWLREQQPKNVVETASLLFALAADTQWPNARREECLALIRKGQDKGGGWGPYVNSSSEPFDTALVLLALARQRNADGQAEMIRRGRAYLLSVQLEDGSWPATTRPAGAESYAHRISTTGWALLALLAAK